MIKAHNAHVACAANDHGYTVRIIQGTETLEEYNGGNHPNDSIAWIDPADPIAVPRRKLRVYAKRTAREMAAERGIAEIRIVENTDLLEEDEHAPR